METAFHDLPAESFPFKIEFMDGAGTIVHTIVVRGPGAVHIPGLAEKYGPVSVRITYPNGEVSEQKPPENG